jgi:phage terminase small subunit
VPTKTKKQAKKQAAKKVPKKAAARPAAKLPASQDPAFDALPLKQRVFVAQYLANGFNATRAAIAAGYAKANADTQGSRLLANPKVAAILARRTQEKLKKIDITADMVLQEIAKLAFLDPRKLFTGDGQLIPITQLDDHTAASIAGLEITEMYEDHEAVGRLKKIKIADKARSLEMLGRYLKLFTEKVEHSGSLGVQLITSVPRPQRKALPK